MQNNARENMPEWQALKAHKQEIETQTISELLHKNPSRVQEFTLSHKGLSYDISHCKITTKTTQLLYDLARACDLESWQKKMFSGAPINHTEGRPALHCALRGSASKGLIIDNQNVQSIVQKSLDQIQEFTKAVHSEQRYKYIVNIGVGGSDIGPNLACQALYTFKKTGIQTYFLSTIDPEQLLEIWDKIVPEETLFIIATKSFGTQETLSSAQTLKEILIKHLGPNANWQNHFAAVTSKEDAAQSFGIPKDQIFYLPPWVGGRFSLWSAIGLSISLTLGFDNFTQLLQGAHDADIHFLEAPFEQNIPVTQALIGIWHRNYFDYKSQCIVPYNYALRLLPRHIQQIDMESNGKRVDRDGNTVNYATAPVVFGEVGTHAQHAFFQEIHQGTDIIPCEMIIAKKPLNNDNLIILEQYNKLIANARGQTKALAEGKKSPNEPHRHFDGDRPSTTIWLDTITPYTLGMLLSFYEHKTFVQSVIWNLNGFDQWGVELGKQISNEILNTMHST